MDALQEAKKKKKTKKNYKWNRNKSPNFIQPNVPNLSILLIKYFRFFIIVSIVLIQAHNSNLKKREKSLHETIKFVEFNYSYTERKS